MKQNHPVVLVRKRKSHHAAHHGGSWKIAYADFMTAMMAFFLVMWLLAIASPQELTQIAEYFRTPLKVALTSGVNRQDLPAGSNGGVLTAGGDVDGLPLLDGAGLLPFGNVEGLVAFHRDMLGLRNVLRLRAVKLERLIAGDVDFIAAVDNRQVAAAFDVHRLVSVQVGGVQPIDGRRAFRFVQERGVAGDGVVLLAPDGGGATAVNIDVLVVFHRHVHVAFGMHVERFVAGRVFQEQEAGVVGAAAFTAAHKAHFSGVAGQIPRRHAVFVVNAAGDDRAIRITVDKVDHHFLTHARDLDPTVFPAGPGARDAHPTGTGFIAAAVAIPTEFEFHPAIFIGPDAFAFRAHYFGSLRAVGFRPRRGARRAPIDVRRNDLKFGSLLANIIIVAGVAVFLHEVLRADHQVGAVVFHTRRLGQLKTVAGRNALRIAFAAHLLVLRFELLLANLDVKLAVGVIGIATGPVEHLGFVLRERGGILPGLQQPRARLTKIVVIQAIEAGRDGVRNAPAIDAVLVFHQATFRELVGNAGVAGEFLMGRRRVSQHQRMAVLLVREIIIDAFVFHQTADEIEIALLILHAVSPDAVVVTQAVIDFHLILPQHLSQDVGNGFFLVDAKIAVLRQIPQRGAQHGAVDIVTVAASFSAGEGHARDIAVEITRCQRIAPQLQRDFLSQQRFQIEPIVGAEQLDVELEQSGQFFLAGKASEQQLMGGQGRVRNDKTIHTIPRFRHSYRTRIDARSRWRICHE